MRIAVGGIHIESSTFTPYISDEEDFIIRRGDELLARYPWHSEYEVKLIPLVHARALPGGVVRRAFYDAWCDEFFGQLKKVMAEGPLDGFFLDIHGAMSVEGLVDAEGQIAQRIRAAIGPDVPMSTSMDLHGNVSDQLFEATDLITCYRTAPHIDAAETRQRAFEQLLEVRGQRHKLVRSKVDVPILLPGEKTSTEVEPGRSIYAALAPLTAKARILDAAIWMGFPWADEARCHASVVVTGWDRTAVETEALRLAELLWGSRKKFVFVGPVAEPETAVLQALHSDQQPFFISDTGDNPGAGGADDMVSFLRLFKDHYKQKESRKRVLFSSIKDEKTMEKISGQPVGTEVSIELGGKIDPRFGGPLEAEFTIEHFFNDERTGPSAVIRHENIYVIVTSRRYQFGNLEQFAMAGITDLSRFDIVVVKMGYLEPELSLTAKDWVMALTPGAVDQAIETLPFRHLKSPLYPFVEDFDPELTAYTLESSAE